MTVTGSVPDVRPYLAEAQLFVVPLRVGGGTRLKMYEGMTMGLPTVSTTIGAEGLPVVHGEHLLLADTPEEITRACVALLQDPVRAAAMGDSADAFSSATSFGWDGVARRFAEFCQAVIPADPGFTFCHERMSSVSVFGLGYVGCVSSACFSREGHTVIGVDVNSTKVALINSGKSTIVEDGIAELVGEMVAAGRLTATTSVADAVRSTPRSHWCAWAHRAQPMARSISAMWSGCVRRSVPALRDKNTFHTIVIRSTVLPGTVHGVATPALERGSGKKAGVDFGCVQQPRVPARGYVDQGLLRSAVHAHRVPIPHRPLTR